MRCPPDGLTGGPGIPEKDPGRRRPGLMTEWGHLRQPGRWQDLPGEEKELNRMGASEAAWAIAGPSGRREGTEVRAGWAGGERHGCARQLALQSERKSFRKRVISGD